MTQGQPKWGIGKSAQHLRAFPPSIYGVDLVLVGCLSAQPPNPPSFIIGAWLRADRGDSGWLGVAPTGGGPIMELGAAPVQSAPAGLQARPSFYRAVS